MKDKKGHLVATIITVALFWVMFLSAQLMA